LIFDPPAGGHHEVLEFREELIDRTKGAQVPAAVDLEVSEIR
jgi:hypothetical protein